MIAGSVGMSRLFAVASTRAMRWLVLVVLGTLLAAPQAMAGLTCSLAVSPTTAATYGETLTYTITYTAATKNFGVVVAEAIPVNTTYVSLSATGTGFPAILYSADGTHFQSTETSPVNFIHWDKDTLNANTTLTASFAVTVNSNLGCTPSPITNTATCQSNSVPTFNSNTVTNSISEPNITGMKSVDKSTVSPGGTITYTVNYTNCGNAQANNAVIADTIPPNSVYVQGSAAVSTGPAATITYQHVASGAFDSSDAAPVIAINWTISVIPAATSGSLTYQVSVP